MAREKGYESRGKSPEVQWAIDKFVASGRLEIEAVKEVDLRKKSELFECAAEHAESAAYSKALSKAKRGARSKVIGLYLNAFAGFVQIGDKERAEYNLSKAESLTSIIVKKWVISDLKNVRRQFEAIKREETAPVIDITGIKSMRRKPV